MPFVPPVELLNSGAHTLWGNLGDWSEAREYPAAAEALAVRLGRVAGLGPGDVVVDVGCGAGDQLRVWARDFGVGRVFAVERDPRLARLASERVAAWRLDGRVSVHEGDALPAAASTTELGEGMESDPPRQRGWCPDGAADHVLALDAAYFFHGRAALFARARRALRPGGVLALADLTLGQGTPARVTRLVAPLCGVPRANLLTPAGWINALREAGFAQVRVHDCTADVLAGFGRWARDVDPRAAGGGPAARALTSFGSLAARMARAGGLGYALVTACSPS